jgi:long-chain acyl-CoA synthetase
MNTAGDALLARWGETVARRADEAAIFHTSGRVLRTFGDVEAEAVQFERERLRTFGRGSVIGVQLGNDAAWPAVLLACLRLGVVVVPMERTMAEQEREAALELCHTDALITSAGGDITIAPRSAEKIDWSGRPPVLLKLTSGTTAAPRAIRFGSEQLAADCEQICDTMGITDADLNFGVIPVSHSYGFSNLITPLLVRGVPLVMSSDRMPRAVLDDLARTEATVFPGMPVFYQAFCDMGDVPQLPKLRLCISAGAPLPLIVAQKFRERFGLAIHSFYGSSECGGICYDRDALLEEQGFVGSAMRGVEIELLEPDAATSRIRVHSAAAADGYFPEPDPEKLGADTFAPDDLLTRTGAGFRIVGRASDIINVAGKKVNPIEIEAALLAFDGVRAAAAFGLRSERRNEEVAACIVADAGVREPDLLDYCRRRLSGWQVPKRLFFLDEMPVNERGKLSRRALAERFKL